MNHATRGMVGVLALMLGGVAPAGADMPDLLRQPLIGLRGVLICGGQLNEYGHEEQMDQALKTAIELQLRQAGIRVLSDEEWRAEPGAPALCLTVTRSLVATDLVAYSVQLELRQMVSLIRDPAIRAWVTTWDAQTRVGAVGPATPYRVMESVREVMEDFIYAYQEINRRP